MCTVAKIIKMTCFPIAKNEKVPERWVTMHANKKGPNSYSFTLQHPGMKYSPFLYIQRLVSCGDLRRNNHQSLKAELVGYRNFNVTLLNKRKIQIYS